MNFDSSRKNYSGLALVAALHLVAAGIALKHSTVWITHPEQTVIVDVPPLREEPPPSIDPPELPRAALPPVIMPPMPVIDVPPYGPTITRTPPDAPATVTDPGPATHGDPDVHREPPRRQPVNVAAVIDAASCAKPAYPASALRNGDEGTVTLAFLVGKDGRVASAKVERTSGNRDLDRAALQGLSLCAFKPGSIDGMAQESWARMQYAWRLDE